MDGPASAIHNDAAPESSSEISLGPTAIEAEFVKFLFTPSAGQEASIVLMGLQFDLEDPLKGRWEDLHG